MANLYIITGPAGVGKSTVSKEIAKKKDKSVLIDGDSIYAQVVGGYTPAWKEGNHLDVFWKVCLGSIDTYLEAGYDVVFNYIVTPKVFQEIKNRFKNYDVKFVVLVTDEETILKRDMERPLDCQMGERCIVLLNNFKKYDLGGDYFLDTSFLSVEETVEIIESEGFYL